MSSRRPLVAASLVAASLLVSLAGVAQAHVVKQFGPYTIALGWLHEPTYLGVENAVQAIVTDSSGKPVTDLTNEELKVVVSAAGKQSAALPLQPSFDPDTGLGTPGEYLASIIPTLPGDYTFHLSGTIHGTAVDETVTSSDQTFDPVTTGASVEFPVTLPAAAELNTGLQRATTRAEDAQTAAQQALVVGGVLGGLGVLLGLAGIAFGLRANRRHAA
jgi:hypothetical protein